MPLNGSDAQANNVEMTREEEKVVFDNSDDEEEEEDATRSKAANALRALKPEDSDEDVTGEADEEEKQEALPVNKNVLTLTDNKSREHLQYLRTSKRNLLDDLSSDTAPLSPKSLGNSRNYTRLNNITDALKNNNNLNSNEYQEIKTSEVSNLQPFHSTSNMDDQRISDNNFKRFGKNNLINGSSKGARKYNTIVYGDDNSVDSDEDITDFTLY
jgi:hypothetical protein